jgi:hypothetical protein
MSPATACLGPLKSNQLQDLFIDQRDQPDAVLAKLERWGVGPLTQMKGSRDRAPVPAADTVAQAVVWAAGPSGVQWLLDKGFAPQQSWFDHAIGSHRSDVAQVLDALVASGLDPHAGSGHPQVGSLWHVAASGKTFDPAVVSWLRTQGVNWGSTNAQGETPLALLMGAISYHSGVRGFFQPSSSTAVRSFGADIMSAMGHFEDLMGQGAPAGKPSFNEAIESDLSSSRKHLDFLEDLAVDMVRSGQSLTQTNASRVAAADYFTPEQSRITQVLAQQAPAGQDPQAYAFSQMFAGPSTRSSSGLRFADPQMYSREQVAFLQRLEQVSGSPLLASPPPAAKPRAAGP